MFYQADYHLREAKKMSTGYIKVLGEPYLARGSYTAHARS